jgi:hypothetical protein
MAGLVHGLARPTRRDWQWIVLFWVAGLAASAGSPEWLAGWEIVLIGGSIGLLIAQLVRLTRLSWRGVLYVGLAAGVAVFWLGDITAAVYLRLGLGAADLRGLETTAANRPWDDRLRAYTGNAALLAVGNAPDNPIWPERAAPHLEAAARFNPYDGEHAYRLAVLETQRALFATDFASHLERAERYFAAAARLSPSDGAIWREWARFALEVRGDPVTAAERARTALRLAANDPEAQTLLSRAEAAWGQR